MTVRYLQKITLPTSQNITRCETSNISKTFAEAMLECHFIILLNEKFISEQGDVFLLLVTFRG